MPIEDLELIVSGDAPSAELEAVIDESRSKVAWAWLMLTIFVIISLNGVQARGVTDAWPASR